jgi:hypothetical protein
MAHPIAAYILMGILASTCLVLTYFSRPVGYTNFATDDDPLRIMDYNIGYLFQLVVRLDHMLEIIYFGFLLALFWLSYAHGKMHLRLEALVEAWAHVKTAEEKHPAYGDGLGVLVRKVEELERMRREDAMRIKELEGKIKNAVKEDGYYFEKIKKEMPSTYTSFAEKRALVPGGVYQGKSSPVLSLQPPNECAGHRSSTIST